MPPLYVHSPSEAVANIQDVLVEVCGVCNAKCPWCITGCQGQAHGSMMSAGTFTECVDKLAGFSLVSPDKSIGLYNWGEPTLNPELDTMLQYLASRSFKGRLSTNGIRLYLPSPQAVKGLGPITYSVSGMTDENESKIHGCSAKTVTGHIREQIKYLRSHGWREHALMAFHVYQHNISDIEAAEHFCREVKIAFCPSFAYLNNYNMIRDYLSGAMDTALLTKASKELMLYYVDSLIASMPKDWRCVLRERQLVIDEQGNVALCCALPRDHEEYTLGKLSDLSPEDIVKLKSNRKICPGCERSGLPWWATHAQGLGIHADWIVYARWIYQHRRMRKLRRILPSWLSRGYGQFI